MSKGNPFLGQARGKVGDVVLYRANGEQITRSRNRQPRNPRTALQLAQRVFLKTSSSAYALMQAICNHSFQGYAEGNACQARFNKLNIDAMRVRLADELNSGDPYSILTSTTANFAARNSMGAEVNEYIISEGSVHGVVVAKNSDAGSSFGIVCELPSTPTYADVVAALGLQQGDQLTFVQLSVDDTRASGVFSGFRYARIILEPNDGDMSTAFFTAGGGINKPNARNQGAVELWVGGQGLSFALSSLAPTSGDANSIAAAACIVSRKSTTGQWLRSTQSLVLRSSLQTDPDPLSLGHKVDFLGDAVASFLSESGSTLYLNQANTQ